MLGLGLRLTAGLGGLTTALLLSRRHRGEQGTSLYPVPCTLKARELEATSLHPVPCNQQSRGQGEHRRSGTARDSAIGSELLNCDEIQELCSSDGSKSSDSRPSVSEIVKNSKNSKNCWSLHLTVYHELSRGSGDMSS